MTGNPGSPHPDEIAEKARYWNSATVDERLGSTFAGQERRAAALMLAGLVGETPDGTEEDSDEASCRLMLAALKVSGGDLTRLRMWVEVARLDPRDLLAAAEYPRELQLQSDEARHVDLVEYLKWARGTS